MGFLWDKRVIAPAIVIALLALGLGAFLAWRSLAPTPAPADPKVSPPAAAPAPVRQVIGTSVEGRDIEAYTYGTGATRLLFVGGIHGGYEWNSVLLAYVIMDHLTANPKLIPEKLSISIIPAANPDGLYKVTGKKGRFAAADVTASQAVQVSGRFNAREVDLNRNFACKWQPESAWRGAKVSAGTAPFSEPEAAAIRDFVLATKPAGAVFWHSQSGTVYASFCEAGILPQTTEIMNAYAKAAGYPTSNTFDAYAVTGDAESWLASIGVPTLTVELTTHQAVEFEKNLAGVKALLGYYGGR